MRHLLIQVTGVLLLLTVSSCKKCSTVITCSISQGAGTNPPRIIGYQSGDIDTVMFVSYQPNGLFDNPIDTVFERAKNIFSTTDTLGISFDHAFTGGSASTSRANDFRLVLPRVQRTYTFTDVTLNGDYEQDIKHNCGSDNYGTCNRQVVSMTINGNYTDLTGRNTGITLYQ